MSAEESFISQDWFRKGNQDLHTVEILLREGGYLEIAGFHLQQAVEKYLKGYLLAKGWRLKRTHDLETLLNSAIKYDADFERFRSACQQITEYYIEERYPFLVPSVLSREVIQSSLETTKELIRKIRETIEGKP